MSAATLRKPIQARTSPIGTGPLHCALETARDLAQLHAFCRDLNCSPADVSSDGKRLDILRVFSLMRGRGYQVSEPRRPQEQHRKGHTTWLVDIHLPQGTRLVMGFQTPNTS